MDQTEKAIEFLQNIGRGDLTALLRYSTYCYVEEEVWFEMVVPVLEITSPALYTEALSGLPDWDQKRIGEAIFATANTRAKPRDKPERIVFNTSPNSTVQEADTLYPEVLIQRNQMITIATGNDRIQDHNDYYRARQRRISATLQTLGIENPNPHDDLWDWYRKWKAEFPTYAERRQYINDMYQPLLDRLVDLSPPPVLPREPTGWERVDRALTKAHARFAAAKHEEDFQTIGLLCREVLISLGQAVYDPEVHSVEDGVRPSDTDAGRMIEGFLKTAAAGGSNENVRKHARAALQLAVELQHKRTAEFRVAALCLEATASITNIVAIIAGRRDHSLHSIT